MKKRIAKLISNKNDIDYLLNVTENDITTSFMMETFGEFNSKCRFNAYDEIIIPKGTYGKEGNKNTEDNMTTVGLWIFNKYFIEKDLFDILFYINENIDSKKMKSINETLSYAFCEDKLTLDVFKRYIMKIQKFMPFVSILSPSYTIKMLTCTKEINKEKNRLINKYKNEIENGDEIIGELIQNELLAYAKEYLGDDSSMDMYLSGARGSFNNNFKDMFIMKGIITNPDPTAKNKYSIATSNYMDGISRKEYSLYANALTAGPYSRAKKTEVGGYWEKLFRDAFQYLVLLPKDSDCGTKDFVTVDITKKNIKNFMYCYVIESNGSLTEITSDNMNNYIDKTIKLRFANMCEAKNGICNKCMGNLYYRLGIVNVGVSLTKIPSILKNKMMKLFHNSQLVFTTMDPMKAFSIKKIK